MPQLNFKRRYVEKILDGTKSQTIRRLRGDGRDPKRGDVLHIFTGLRTKATRRLGRAIVAYTMPIRIDDRGITLGRRRLVAIDRDELARKDGFESWPDMRKFFNDVHMFPFEGILIVWQDFKAAR